MQQATGSPVAAEALRRIAELYTIETAIRGYAADARQSMRQSRSFPLITAMKTWLEMRFAQIPPRGSLADAIRYTLSRWEVLCCFLDDGRVELDTNTVERAIRPVTLGRKNHLFDGSDGGANRWATVCSLVTTALCRRRLRRFMPTAELCRMSLFSNIATKTLSPSSKIRGIARRTKPHGITTRGECSKAQ